MEKKQLIQKIAEGANITRAQAEKAIMLFTQVLSTALNEGKKIPKYLIPESPADAPLWSTMFPFGIPLFVRRRAFLKEQYLRALRDYRKALLEELEEVGREIEELEKTEKETEKE
jgi:Bacterial DNA-binding protein